MSRKKHHVLGFAFLLAAAISVPAFAQPSGTTPYPACGTKTVSASESDLAHQKYIAGKQDYDEGNYDSAIRRFRDAYGLDCTKHELLIIISAAYERKGDKKEALNALETYVARAPSAPDVGTYQAKIDNLKKQIATAPPPTTTTAPSGTSSPPPGGEVQEHTPWPWVVVGIGGAAVVVGIVVIVVTPSLPKGCTTDGAKTCAPLAGEDPKDPTVAAELLKRQEEAGRIHSQPLVGGIVAGIGGALVVGGLVWHFLEPTGPKEAAAASWQKKIRPAVSPGYAGLSLGGTF